MSDQSPLVMHHALEAKRLDDGRLELSLPGSGEAVFRMQPVVGAVLSLFDGVRTLSEIQREAALRQVPIGLASLEALARRLAADGMLVPIDQIPTETIPGARVLCAGCTDCCHLLVGPLSPADVQRIESLDWQSKDEVPPKDWLQVFGEPAESYLSQTESGACFFLDDDGLCRIHRHFGAEAKPTPCRLFPLLAIRRAGRVRLGVSYECPSQHRAEHEGEALQQQGVELQAVIAAATQDFSMLQDVDPGGRLWACVAGPPPPEDPEEALFALCRAAQALDVEVLRLPDLLQLLVDLLALGSDTSSSPRLASDHRLFLAELEALFAELQSGTLGPLPRLDEEAARFQIRYLQNQVFLGEPVGRLGVGAGVSLWVLGHVLGVRLAAKAPELDVGRPMVSAAAMAYGLSKAVSGLRCVELMTCIDGAGSALVDDVLVMLRALTARSAPA